MSGSHSSDAHCFSALSTRPALTPSRIFGGGIRHARPAAAWRSSGGWDGGPSASLMDAEQCGQNWTYSAANLAEDEVRWRPR
jgi:hypothetical protein